MNDGDVYWENVFRYARRRADIEIERFKEQTATAKDRQWELYAPWLVEPQRYRRDLLKDLERYIEEEIALLRVALAGAEEMLPAEWEREMALSHTFRGLALAAIAEEGTALGRRLVELKGLADSRTSAGEALRRLLAFLETGTDDPATILVTISKDQKKDKKGQEKEEATAPETPTSDETPELLHVSHPEFTLDEVPREELRRRLNRGEIAPRKEWIPSLAGENRKQIDEQEFAARIEFADRLNREAKACLAKGDQQGALTLFTQGVHLLDVVTSEDMGKAQRIQIELSRFRRNRALMASALEQYREAIESCSQAVKEDESDGKALFIRGRARLMLGEVKAAIADFRALAHSPYVTDAQRQVGALEWRKAQKLLAKDKRSVIKIVTRAAEQADFSTGRESAEAGLPANSQTVCPAQPPPIRLESLGGISTPGTGLWTYPEPQLLDGESFIQLLKQMIRTYTAPEVAKQLDKLRFEAEYDEKRMMVKLRHFMPEILGGVYSSFGLPGDNFASKQREFDLLLGYYHSAKCPDVKLRQTVRKLVAGCREALMGPIID